MTTAQPYGMSDEEMEAAGISLGTAQPGQEQRMEIAPLTDEEVEAAFGAVIEMLDKRGSAPAATVGGKDGEGVTFSLHFSASRIRRLLEATRPTADLGEDGELDRRLRARTTNDGLGDPDDDLINPDGPEAADRLVLYREALEGLVAEFEKFSRYGSPIAMQANEAMQRARAVLSRSGG